MSNAVAIGYKEDILPLGVCGIRLLPIASPDELIPTLNKLTQETALALIIISEAVVVGAGLGPAPMGLLRTYMTSSPIPILILPTHRGSYGTGLRDTAEVIKKAIGIDILEGA